MKREMLACGICLMLSLTACRGPIRNPAALTPLPTRSPMILPTITTPPLPTVPPTLTPIVVIHKVQEGDSLSAISQKYNTTIEAIQQLNGMGNNTTVYIGQKLKIPQ